MTEILWNLKPGLRNYYCIVAVIVFASLNTIAQSTNDITIPFSKPIQKAFLDRPGDLYIVTDESVTKLTQDGTVINTHTFQLPTLFDPWYAVHYFSYSRNNQQSLLLHPDFELKEVIPIDPVYAIDPYLVCLSGEKNLWIYDQADTSIKKINTSEQRVIIDETIHLPDKPDVIFMREYQGFLFILDYNHGILVFNMVGKLLKTIGKAGIADFNFLGEELYYLQNNTIHFFDLFDGRTQEKLLSLSPKQVLLTDKVAYFIFHDRVIITNNH